jgi:hypothetical protein
MKLLEDFYPYVRPFAPGASDLLLEQYVRDACIELATRSHIIKADLDPITVIDGILQYEWDQPEQQRVLMVYRAFYGDARLIVHGVDSPAFGAPSFGNSYFAGASVPTGTPRVLRQLGDIGFVLDSAPAQVGEIMMTVHAALKPDRKCSRVDDMLFEDYANDIALGAASKILMIPGQAFSNPSLAAGYGSLFNAACEAAKLRAAQTYGRPEMQVQFNRI